MNSGLAKPELTIGLGLLAFSALGYWQILEIPVSPMYAKVGPTVFPYLAVLGLALFSLLLVVKAFQGGWQEAEEKEVALDWRAFSFVVAGLVANLTMIEPLGFTAASTVMFTLITFGFGSRQVLRNTGIGMAVALVSYFGFAKLLGVNIGAGLIENLLGG